MSTRMPKGCYVFLVEDEVMIRMMVADMLQELGYRVAGEAGRVEEALGLVQRTEFDIAIMDINLHGEPVFPVAKTIKERNRPFIFCDRLQRVYPARRISRSAGIAKAVSDRNPGKTT